MPFAFVGAEKITISVGMGVGVERILFDYCLLSFVARLDIYHHHPLCLSVPIICSPYKNHTIIAHYNVCCFQTTLALLEQNRRRVNNRHILPTYTNNPLPPQLPRSLFSLSPTQVLSRSSTVQCTLIFISSLQIQVTTNVRGSTNWNGVRLIV